MGREQPGTPVTAQIKGGTKLTSGRFHGTHKNCQCVCVCVFVCVFPSAFLCPVVSMSRPAENTGQWPIGISQTYSLCEAITVQDGHTPLWMFIAQLCLLSVHMVKPKLQALVYDILPSEEGAGKRCSECG